MNESERLYQKLYAYVTRTTPSWDMATLRQAHPQIAGVMHDLITSNALGVSARGAVRLNACGSRCCNDQPSA